MSWSWLILLLAGLLEIGWAIGLKLSDGLSRPLITAATFICFLASVGLLALAVRDLPVGTAYAVWAGIGAVGTLIVGIIAFNEPVTALRLGAAGLIMAGIFGLKLASA